MRDYLKHAQVERDKLLESDMLLQRRHSLEKKAGNLHHLLSTKAVPGVSFFRKAAGKRAGLAGGDIPEDILSKNSILRFIQLN
jgi:hypothetical protein